MKKNLLKKEIPKKRLLEKDFTNIYLVDKVADKDLFDHQDFSDILEKIITDSIRKKEDFPFNVGIFGKWGTGKSTVFKLFRKSIEENKKYKNKIAIIEFKVWKFSKEALRNKFIFAISKILHPDKFRAIYERVYCKKTMTTSLLENPEALISELKKWNKNIPKGLIALGLVLGLLFMGLLFLLKTHFNWKVLDSVTGFLNTVHIFLMAQIPTVLSYVSRSLKEAKISVSHSAYDSQEQFEDEFIAMIKDEKNIKKIIFIDDLDRCNEDKVIETLETIKTYLDVETCVFVIACDDEVIRKIVRAKRQSLAGEDDSLSYLNKFFQYIVRIPPFVHQNMEHYAKQLLAEQNNDLKDLPEIDHILDVLVHDEANNPRQVIALINNFANDFVISLKRENDTLKKLHPGEITKRLPVLAVFTVIKADYPDYYLLLMRDSNLFKYILEAERRSLKLEEHHRIVLEEIYEIDNPESMQYALGNYKKGTQAKEFVNFILKVEDTIRDVEDFNLFIYLNRDQSSYALGGTRFNELRKFVRSGNERKVKDLIDNIQSGEIVLDYFNVVVDTIQQSKSNDEKVRGLKCFFFAIDDLPSEGTQMTAMAKNIMAEVNIATQHNETWFEKFNLSGVFFTLNALGSAKTKIGSIDLLIESLENTEEMEFADTLILEMFKYQHLINRTQANEIIKILLREEPEAVSVTALEDVKQKEHTYFNLEDLCSYVTLFKDNDEVVLKFFSTNILTEIINEIVKLDNGEDSEETESKLLLTLISAYNSIDEILNRHPEQVEIKTDGLLKLLSTHEFFPAVIDKLSEMKDIMPLNKKRSSIKKLIEELGNREDTNDFLLALKAINTLSDTIDDNPIDELSPIMEKIASFLIQLEEEEALSGICKYLVHFNNGRLKESDYDRFWSLVFEDTIISKYPKSTPMIYKFALDNDELVSEASKSVLNQSFFQDILREKTYDSTLFPADEGIVFYSEIAPEVLKGVANKESLVDINTFTSLFQITSNNLSLTQKEYLLKIVRCDFCEDAIPFQENILSLLVPYIASPDIQIMTWGMNNFHETYSLSSKESFSDSFKAALISSLINLLTVSSDLVLKNKSFHILYDFIDDIVAAKGSDLTALLPLIEEGFEPGSNHEMAFKLFLKTFSDYQIEDHVRISGKYLGSEAVAEDSTKKLIQKIKDNFLNLLNEVLPIEELKEEGEEDEENDDEQSKPENKSKQINSFIDEFVSNISVDENAWTFISHLLRSLLDELEADCLRDVNKHNFAMIRQFEESSGIARNRFSVIIISRDLGLNNYSEAQSVFDNMFNSDSEEQIIVALDNFELYYDLSNIKKQVRQHFKGTLENTKKRFNDENLIKKIDELLKRL